jgi:hypothetical protein
MISEIEENHYQTSISIPALEKNYGFEQKSYDTRNYCRTKII